MRVLGPSSQDALQGYLDDLLTEDYSEDESAAVVSHTCVENKINVVSNEPDPLPAEEPFATSVAEPGLQTPEEPVAASVVESEVRIAEESIAPPTIESEQPVGEPDSTSASEAECKTQEESFAAPLKEPESPTSEESEVTSMAEAAEQPAVVSAIEADQQTTEKSDVPSKTDPGLKIPQEPIAPLAAEPEALLSVEEAFATLEAEPDFLTVEEPAVDSQAESELHLTEEPIASSTIELAQQISGDPAVNSVAESELHIAKESVAPSPIASEQQTANEPDAPLAALSPKREARDAAISSSSPVLEADKKDELQRMLAEQTVDLRVEPKQIPDQLKTTPETRVPQLSDTEEQTNTSDDELPEANSDLLKWGENGRPVWAEGEFEALLFDVAGLSLAVPLVTLGQIVAFDEKLTVLHGQSAWFMGILPTAIGDIRTVNTALFVMPERYNETFLETAKYVVTINNMPWGLAVDSVNQPITLDPDDVKWRATVSTRRPWLAGTVKSHMATLIDIPEMARMLEDSDKNR